MANATLHEVREQVAADAAEPGEEHLPRAQGARSKERRPAFIELSFEIDELEHIRLRLRQPGLEGQVVRSVKCHGAVALRRPEAADLLEAPEGERLTRQDLEQTLRRAGDAIDG